MQAGRLDQRITIQTKSVTRASNGEEVVAWVALDTVWAEVKPLRAKEFFAAAQMQGSVDHQVRLRWRDDIARDMRLMWRDQPLDIVGIAELGRRDGLEIMAISGVRNG
jgi:SPP1 family predicted phage head-tail adaptor